MSPSTRRALHAASLVEHGLGGTRAPRRAVDLRPGADAARLLDEAAARARSRGAPDAAATLAQHALRLTPPPDLVEREERALAIAGYLMDAGQIADAGVVLDGLLGGAMRAEGAHARC